jgi:hypothetical protein
MAAHQVLTAGARAELRAALIARTAAREALVAARAATSRAHPIQGRAEMHLFDCMRDANRMERAAASRIVAHAQGEGGERPTLASPEFQAILLRRAEAESNVSAAKSAVATLEATRDDAERQFNATESTIQAAAAAVLVEEAKLLVARLLKARSEAWELEATLSALMAMRLPVAGAAPRPVAVPRDMIDAVNNREKPWIYVPPGARDEGEEAWKRLREALVAGDADATLERAP